MSRQLSDWLEHYMRYTQRSEPPALYHIWCGLTAISSALRRKCYCDWGPLRGYMYPNMFVSLVGPPGGRKGTAMKIAKSMIQELGIPLGADSLGSTQALYKELMDSEDTYVESNGITKKHKSLSIWSEEFRVFLSDRDQMLIPSLTDLFDCADVWKYKTLSRKTEDISNCFITLIGGITPALLQESLSQTSVGGGLISRIIFVVGHGPKQRSAIQYLTDEEEDIRKKLCKDLQEIANLQGQFKMDKSFLRAYIKWYERDYDYNSVRNDKFAGYNNRKPIHINKLCMLLSASESNDLILTEKHLLKALAILQTTEYEMPGAFYGLGMSDKANVYTKILSFIEAKDSFDFSELVQAFHLDVESIDQLRNHVDMASQAGLIKCESSITTERYHVIKTAPTIDADPDYLNKTVLRLMDQNKVKYG
ncbi:MAG TPA: DUF3987 domain-containing protein [Halanaerobiales bacterium]|nr:DUF3987 domain-containing protein [Halanaerobiales bacterium]